MKRYGNWNREKRVMCLYLKRIISLCIFFSLSTVCISDVLIVGSGDVPVLSEDLATQIFLKKSDILPNGVTAVPIDLSDKNFVKWDFYHKLAGKQPAQIHSYWSRALFNGIGSPPEQVSSAIELKEKLLSTPGAIGYIDEKDVSPGRKVVLRIRI